MSKRKVKSESKKDSPEKRLKGRSVWFPVISIEGQWELVAQYRHDLIQSATEYPEIAPSDERAGIPGIRNQAMANLEHTWSKIDKRAYPWFAKDRHQVTTGTPIEEVTLYTRVGLYPPPELLLAVQLVTAIYFTANGERSMEEAVFGRVKPGRSGNYAKRRNHDIEALKWSLEFNADRRNVSPIEKARAIGTRHTEGKISERAVLDRIDKFRRKTSPIGAKLERSSNALAELRSLDNQLERNSSQFRDAKAGLDALNAEFKKSDRTSADVTAAFQQAERSVHGLATKRLKLAIETLKLQRSANQTFE